MKDRAGRSLQDPNQESAEIDSFLDDVSRAYGYDFRDYARASLNRRIRAFAARERLDSIPAMHEKVLSDSACFERFIVALTVNVTALFRDPGFFLAFRRKVVPLLRTYPFFRIWCAGCSTGEEVYSVAIVMEEEGLHERCKIYATDINDAVLEKASAGLFPLSSMEECAKNYLGAGGTRSFSDYYTAAYGKAMFLGSLRRNTVFSRHNLVTDGVFNEFQTILCRNVMIYFNNSLRDHTHNLIYDSLVNFGVLGLGTAESVQFTPHEKDYERLDSSEKLYRRVR